MPGKYSFRLKNEDRRRDLPGKIIIGQDDAETSVHVLLKLFAFLLFHRDRLQIEANLHFDSIPFIPDVVELDYELRPKLWVECGECTVNKLDKLAVKVPEAEIWVFKKSEAVAQELIREMAKRELRQNRYGLVAMDGEMFAELCGLLKGRNEVLWVKGEFEPPQMQFDFNGLWFEMPFSILRF